MPSWRERGGPARTIGTAISRAVDGARAGDRSEFETAAAALAALPAEQTGLVLGALVRLLLEEQHIDGIDADDIAAVLSRCYQQAVAWLPSKSVEIEPLVAVLSSALGIHEPGVTYREITASTAIPAGAEWVDPEISGSDARGSVRSLVPSTAQYTWHAPLLIADLLQAAHRSLPGCLDRAFDEIAKTQTMEMP